MRIITLILCIIVLLATGLPLIQTSAWWIRIFDFPRVQIATLILLTIVLSVIFIEIKWTYKIPLIVLLISALIYQLQFVAVYSPLYATQAKTSKNEIGENSMTLLVSNVRMENEDRESFNILVNKYQPDIVLINEPNDIWAASISRLEGDFQYSIKHPLNNTYGMILLSKLPLTESRVHFLYREDIPSIFTKITLPSGSKIDFYGVHPVPPKPGTDTYERDTELLLIGNKIRETQNPSIVAGDLNDVGWSMTSKLFRKHSLLVDPREGRGLFNTYSVFIPLFRYPLDHIFYSKEFGLLRLEKLEDIGSDHYPLMIELNYEPENDNTQGLETTDKQEEKKVQEKLKEGKSKRDKQ